MAGRTTQRGFVRRNVAKAQKAIDNPERGGKTTTRKAPAKSARKATSKKSGYSISAPRKGGKRSHYGKKMGRPTLKGGNI